MSTHTYYRLTLEAVSPVSVGSGSDSNTDHDCIRHRNGSPFIPASTVAGVFRHGFSGSAALERKLFGTIEGVSSASSIIFYDCEPVGKYSFSVRDGVRLRNKVAVDKAKFDIEVVETGARFVTYIELDKDGSEYKDIVDGLISGLDNGLLRFGHKTSRGYGIMKVTEKKEISFDLDSPEELEKWLSFDMFADSSWAGVEATDTRKLTGDSCLIHLSLRQRGAVTIRVYTTDLSLEQKAAVKAKQSYTNETLRDSDDLVHAPDYKHITLSDGTPVIPGTSWAGAFRARFAQLMGESGEEAVKSLFGIVEEDEAAHKTITKPSRIFFSESKIKKGTFTPKLITRNSIDRFSSKTKDSALYKEYTCYGGDTELDIVVPADISEREKFCLSTAIYDLSQGYLAVGGLTTVGHGLFSVTGMTVNGEDKTGSLVPEKLMEMWR
ncbi:MAG: hypothetical protein IJ874_05745 [Ruminococcus sp.]|nr:hypothetical protein [Ruminococcus sp.]